MVHASKQRRLRARWIAAMRITVSAICTSVISSYVVDSDWASAGSPDSLLDANPGIEVEDAADSDADMFANLVTVIW